MIKWGCNFFALIGLIIAILRAFSGFQTLDFVFAGLFLAILIGFVAQE